MNDLQTYIDEGRLIRERWTDTDEDGRQLACLLAALSPEVAEAEDPSACPADVMPQWLAYLTPWLDDEPSEQVWPGIVRRYAALSTRWHVLDNRAWRRAEYGCRAVAVREAMRHTDDAEVLAACENLATLCERVAVGDEPDDEGWEASARAAAVDRMAGAMLDVIEAEIERAEVHDG